MLISLIFPIYMLNGIAFHRTLFNETAFNKLLFQYILFLSNNENN